MQPPVDLVQPQVVHADDLAAVDVDDLLVHQVVVQQDLVAALLEPADVDGGSAQVRAAVVKRRDRRPGQEDATPIGVHDEPGDRRIAIADLDDQVGHLADRLALASRTGRPVTWLR